MARRDDALNALARVAKLKSDQELRRFSAFRAHVVVAEARVQQVRDELAAVMAGSVPTSLDDLRAVSAVVNENAGALLRAQSDLARMKPGFDAARAKAVQAFGRAQAMTKLHEIDVKTRAAARHKQS